MESINSIKFTKLSNNEMKVLFGGIMTAGGCEQNGMTYQGTRNGKDVSITPMRGWSSDETDGQGYICYNDEDKYETYKYH